MRLTKLGHACIRLEHEGATVVIDPGVFTDPGATAGAGAVLVTHEHPDHWTPDQLRAAQAPVFTIQDVADQIGTQAPDLLERVAAVAPGGSFDAAGVAVEAVGEQHAVIYEELPRIANSGYLLTLGELTVFHPGDALTVPGRPVDVLLLPVSAPWLKISEAIDFARAVGAPRNVAIHDRVYSEVGLGVIGGHLDRFLGDAGLSYLRLADGEELS